MTPVAPPVAVHAMSWDAALEETLSRATEHRRVFSVPAIVHSVHRRAVNILTDGTLVTIVSDEFDDAPATIRMRLAELHRLGLREGDEVVFAPAEIRFAAPDGDRVLDLRESERWMPADADLSGLTPLDLDRAHQGLEQLGSTAPPRTPFGRASATLLAAGIDRLRTACPAERTPTADAGVITAVGRLVGLGEGLTPSGDDILTGLAFLASQPGMQLNHLIPSLAAGIDAHASRTSLLSVVTMRAAVAGRGRQCMHDLGWALATGDTHALSDAAAQVLAIGHSSGADLLTGIRLALELESRERATMPAERRITTTRPTPSDTDLNNSPLKKEITR